MTAGVGVGVAAEGVGDAATVVDEVYGFKYFDARDLVGFVDGTENPAGPEATVWARVPAPLFRGADTPSLRQPQGLRSGVNAIIGRWPGDETEELAAALKELS